MNRLGLVCLVLTFVVVFGQTRGTEAQTGVELDWQMDYVKAHQMRVESQRPMLVFLTMDGCPFCNKMMEATYGNQQVASDVSRMFVPTYINGSHQQDLAKQFGVRIYPTTFVIGPDNRLLDRIEGFLPANKMQQRIAMISRRMASRPGVQETQ